MKQSIYRIKSWLKHHITAWNTGGEGVHSPYLFEWVRMVMSDKHAYYMWHEIESVREEMLQDPRVVEFVDYGSAKRRMSTSKEQDCFLQECRCGDEARDERHVKDIARGSLARKKYAQMMYRLVNWLGEGKGLNIIELGTSLGVTTAYLAAADSRNKVVSYEGCAAVAEIAEENWRKLGLKNVECRVGEITEGILQVIDNQVDVAFVDANHTYASTCAYFNMLAEKVHEKSVIIVDDIHHSEEMERAWKEICADTRVTSTMDLYQMGLVFFDQHYWKRNYRMIL